MYLAPKDEYGEIKRWKDATISSGNPNSLLSLHRLYNPNSGEHFYTCEQDEKDHLVSLDWKDEDAAWKVPKTSDQPFYRLYNPNNGDHHFTTSEDEKESLVKVGWKDEGIGFYVHPMNEKDHHPVYRQYNPNAHGAGSHNYTINKEEHDYLVSIGWKDEGIAWYGCSKIECQSRPPIHPNTRVKIHT